MKHIQPTRLKDMWLFFFPPAWCFFLSISTCIRKISAKQMERCRPKSFDIIFWLFSQGVAELWSRCLLRTCIRLKAKTEMSDFRLNVARSHMEVSNKKCQVDLLTSVKGFYSSAKRRIAGSAATASHPTIRYEHPRLNPIAFDFKSKHMHQMWTSAQAKTASSDNRGQVVQSRTNCPIVWGTMFYFDSLVFLCVFSNFTSCPRFPSFFLSLHDFHLRLVIGPAADCSHLCSFAVSHK